MQLPFISRKHLEHTLKMHQLHADGIAFAEHQEGVAEGLKAVYRWLTDSQAKAEEIRTRDYAKAPETWKTGWDSGQQWIAEAIADLALEIKKRETVG